MVTPFVLENIARIAHEINRAYCEALGDFSQRTWEDAPDWQKESAKAGVMFHFENPKAGPEASHESWMKKKLEEGWAWGPVKDPENKLHPCIVAFDKLPIEQQAKDYLFRQTVHSLWRFVAEVMA
jgi:RyR domain.